MTARTRDTRTHARTHARTHGQTSSPPCTPACARASAQKQQQQVWTTRRNPCPRVLPARCHKSCKLLPSSIRHGPRGSGSVFAGGRNRAASESQSCVAASLVGAHPQTTDRQGSFSSCCRPPPFNRRCCIDKAMAAAAAPHLPPAAAAASVPSQISSIFYELAHLKEGSEVR